MNEKEESNKRLKEFYIMELVKMNIMTKEEMIKRLERSREKEQRDAQELRNAYKKAEEAFEEYKKNVKKK